MNDYIKRENAVNAVEFGITLASAINIETGERTELFQKENDELREAVKRIKDIEPADVVKVVRCKDCEWATKSTELPGWYMCKCEEAFDDYAKPDDFCSHGKRREE